MPAKKRGRGVAAGKARKRAAVTAGPGIVDLHIRTYNQHDKLVAECKRQAFMLTQPS